MTSSSLDTRLRHCNDCNVQHQQAWDSGCSSWIVRVRYDTIEHASCMLKSWWDMSTTWHQQKWSQLLWKNRATPYIIHVTLFAKNGRGSNISTVIKLNKKIIIKRMITAAYGNHNGAHIYAWHTKHSKLSAVAYMFTKLQFLCWITSSADGHLNTNMHSLTIQLYLEISC